MMRIICFDFMGADDITRVWARSFVKSHDREGVSGQLQNLWERGDEKPLVVQYRASTDGFSAVDNIFSKRAEN